MRTEVHTLTNICISTCSRHAQGLLDDRVYSVASDPNLSPSQEQPFRCPDCARTFGLTSELQRHARIHELERKIKELESGTYETESVPLNPPSLESNTDMAHSNHEQSIAGGNTSVPRGQSYAHSSSHFARSVASSQQSLHFEGGENTSTASANYSPPYHAAASSFSQKGTYQYPNSGWERELSTSSAYSLHGNARSPPSQTPPSARTSPHNMTSGRLRDPLSEPLPSASSPDEFMPTSSVRYSPYARPQGSVSRSGSPSSMSSYSLESQSQGSLTDGAQADKWTGHRPTNTRQPSGAAKPKRRRANAEQLQALNEVYGRTTFPSTGERKVLAQRLSMSPRQVQIW